MAEPAGPPQLPPEAAARLSAAEDRLYPLAMVDVERYQRGTTLCGLLLEDLRLTAPDIPSVLSRRPSLVELVPALASRASVSLIGLHPETLVDAASALRCRELEAERLHALRQARIAAARGEGQEWLVDEPSPAAVMAGFFRRVELHLPTGTRLVSSVEAGGAGQPVTYALELVPPSGLEQPAKSEIFDDEGAWRRAAKRYRAEISGRP